MFGQEIGIGVLRPTRTSALNIDIVLRAMTQLSKSAKIS